LLDHRRRRSTGEVVIATMPESADGAGDPAELRLTLVDALAQLKPVDRAIVVLRYWEDYSVEQVASLLELREGAVRTRSMRALATLREILDTDLAELLS
jgi:RNA polymerase sigma factor (sigma-70 family)